jgi:PKD repeat protein
LPAATATYDQMPDSLVYTSAYTVRANVPCALSTNQPPLAVLSASPRQGSAPLNVAFDASGSSDPDAGDAIASYTFSFGDGSPDVTQSSPTINHTYRHGGAFFATCTVTDTQGEISANVASLVIKTGAQLVNISTRLRTQTGDNIPIAGFIVVGDQDKKVIVRGIGPSIQGAQGPLQDPVLELHDSSGAVIASNDNWKDTQQAEIEGSGVPPGDDRESAIVKTLSPGNYTAILRGKDDTTGVALVEVYDISFTTDSRLANVSTRGLVGTGDDVMIGGFLAGPNDAAFTGIVLRAIGPSLGAANVPQPMQDPTLELHDRDGALIDSNDNWKDSPQAAEIESTGLQPTDDRESAIIRTNFEPGPYTAILRGKDNSVGNALVEIYDVRQ